MSATPEAHNEYSRGPEPSSGDFRAARRAASGPAWRRAQRRSAGLEPGLRGLLLAGALVAGGLLVVAEFTTLYQAHLAGHAAPIQTVTAGSHNSYAMLPIALLAVLLGLSVWRTGTQPVLVAIGVLGVVALLIALLHDLPDTHAVGLADNNSVSATTTPSAGLYLETLGAILLIATSGIGLAMAGLPRLGRASGGRRAA